MTIYPRIRLNPKADYRINRGHLWIYSNEIDNKFAGLKNFAPGSLVAFENAIGKKLGIGYINPNTLICGRILISGDENRLISDIFEQRITSALALREGIFKEHCYRLIYGESDLLPGLVVDRFKSTLVVQVATAGMEKLLDTILGALQKVVQPEHILLKNDGKMRQVEGLESYVKWFKGGGFDEVELLENGVKFLAPIIHGQKTGWFYDHRMMRERLRNYVVGKRVLDVFSYVGGWGVQAAAFGAKEVILSDVSEFALSQVVKNAQLNNLQNVATKLGDAFDVMQEFYDAGKRFDVVILDPPAFIPRQKDLAKGLAAYQKANTMAAKLLNEERGILVTGSCSMHLPTVELKNILQKTASKLQRNIQILEQGHQAPDHPIHPSIPETEYLKSIIAVMTKI